MEELSLTMLIISGLSQLVVAGMVVLPVIYHAGKKSKQIETLEKWQAAHDKDTGTIDAKIEQYMDDTREILHTIDKRLDRIERNGNH